VSFKDISNILQDAGEMLMAQIGGMQGGMDHGLLLIPSSATLPQQDRLAECVHYLRGDL